MAKFARDKGQRGEREIVDMFVAAMVAVEAQLGIDAAKRLSEHVKRNTLQADRGGHDIVGIPLLAIEVKRCETLAINQWWQQTVAQAAKFDAMPVLFYRQSRKPWRCMTHTSLCFPGHPCAQWVVSDFPATDFLPWYGRLYAEYLTGGADRG